MSRPFNSEHVVEEKNFESTLKAYHVGFDQGEFRLIPLVNVIRSVIPEFALGYHEGKGIPLTQMVEKLREAAETVYQTDKYQKRGEFGELILHFLLRDFFRTIPLISKIYFKDSSDVPAHGFDGVQITVSDSGNGLENKLWLGESKLYTNGSAGVAELAKDFEEHLNADYLRREFTLISRKLPSNIPEIEHWRNLLDKNQKLDNIFSSIVIPMVCTYTSPLFRKHSKETEEFFDAFETEARKLHSTFQEKIGETKVEAILLLLPVPSKNKLTKELNSRLKAMQSI